MPVLGGSPCFLKKRDGFLLPVSIDGQDLFAYISCQRAIEALFIGEEGILVDNNVQDVRDIGGLLQRAGFALPVTDSDTLTIRYANMFALMEDLRAMGAGNS